jgi:hypothetical protein
MPRDVVKVEPRGGYRVWLQFQDGVEGKGALLEREREFYATHEAEWMAAHPGRFVVVKDERLLGAFADPPD